jgi:hypothetical protein
VCCGWHTPDDGWKYHPKYVEQFPDINKLCNFGKQMNKDTKLIIHNITAKAALKFGSEAWVPKKREE